MPDRHFELPAHPDLEYYRKQAKHLLRSYEAGDAVARDRAAEVLGDRAAERFLLSDAQFVLAQEHGFRTWAEFRADIQSRDTTSDRPPSRLWGQGPGSYASWADHLLTELRNGDPEALARLRAAAPRYAAATDAATAELRDARLVIAWELGFPTWRELVAAAERSQRDDEERQERQRRLRPEAEALLAGDTARLAQLTPGQAGTLLQMLAMRELLGTKLGEGLGVSRAAVDVLIGKATSLDRPLSQAVRADRVDYVRLLLDAGADLAARNDGTPLENAIYAGNTRMVDLLAERGIVPGALWTYAACGRLDLVRACFDTDGRPRPDAALPRPSIADFMPFPARNLATSDPEQIMAEAFVHACQLGRTEVVRWFLDRGLNPDAAPYFGRTALVWAVMAQQVEVVRLLMERGADPDRGDDTVPFGAKALVVIFFAAVKDDPVVRQLDMLLNSRSG
jgi:hypothetical protein